MKSIHSPNDVILDRYRIIQPLGQGGMGSTYEAEDLESCERLALKVLSLRQMSDWKILELFQREAAVLASLKHPAIPQYLASFDVDLEDDRRFYLAQTLVEGRSLGELIANGWRADEATVKSIAEQILDVLAYLQNRIPPVIHRDIKPDNLIRQTNGKIALVDFGAVQDVYRQTITKSATFVGTLGYMPPEQFQGRVEPASDLYALGVTLITLLSGKTPDQLPQIKMKLDWRSSVQEVTPISQKLSTWIDTLIDPLVENRPQTAAQALLALQGSSRTFLSTRQNGDHQQTIGLDSETQTADLFQPPSDRIQCSVQPHYCLIDIQLVPFTPKSELIAFSAWIWHGLTILYAAFMLLVIVVFFAENPFWDSVGVSLIVLLMTLPPLGVSWWLVRWVRSLRGQKAQLELTKNLVKLRKIQIFNYGQKSNIVIDRLMQVSSYWVRRPSVNKQPRLVRFVFATHAGCEHQFDLWVNDVEKVWLTEVLGSLFDVDAVTRS